MIEVPRISVIVPFFNNERHISACIEALLAQEIYNEKFEIIMVNNRSTDRSASIVAQYRGLTVLEESTPGAYAARNTAIRHVKSPILAFTDADCIVGHGWLRTILEGLQDPTVAILVGHCRYPRDASLTLRLLGAYENLKAEYIIERCEPAYHFAYANNMAVRTSVFREFGLFQEWKRAGDTELVHRLASVRPDLRIVFRKSMRISHLEFRRARDRARRLSLYTRTNAKISSFQELGFRQRVGLVGYFLRKL